MVVSQRQLVIGVFRDPAGAHDAIGALRDAGFDADGTGAAVGGDMIAGGIFGGLAG